METEGLKGMQLLEQDPWGGSQDTRDGLGKQPWSGRQPSLHRNRAPWRCPNPRGEGLGTPRFPMAELARGHRLPAALPPPDDYTGLEKEGPQAGPAAVGWGPGLASLPIFPDLQYPIVPIQWTERQKCLLGNFCQT